VPDKAKVPHVYAACIRSDCTAAAKLLYAPRGTNDGLIRVAFVDLELWWKGRQATAVGKSALNLAGDPDVVIASLAVNEASDRDEQFGVRSEGI
jgi:hypothetical protein